MLLLLYRQLCASNAWQDRSLLTVVLQHFKVRRGSSSQHDRPLLHSRTYEVGDALLERHPALQQLSARKLIKQGYQQQAELVLRQLQPVVAEWHRTRRGGIVEGVHLSLKAVVHWLREFPKVLPFLVRSPPAAHCRIVTSLEHTCCVFCCVVEWPRCDTGNI